MPYVARICAKEVIFAVWKTANFGCTRWEINKRPYFTRWHKICHLKDCEFWLHPLEIIYRCTSFMICEKDENSKTMYNLQNNSTMLFFMCLVIWAIGNAFDNLTRG